MTQTTPPPRIPLALRILGWMTMLACAALFLYSPEPLDGKAWVFGFMSGVGLMIGTLP